MVEDKVVSSGDERLRSTPRRVFQPQSMGPIHLSPLLFSPTLSLILGCSTGVLGAWRLDGLPIVARPDTHTPVTVLSHCGTYIIISHRLDITIAVAFIDTGMKIRRLALISNALLILNSDELVAWRLTEEGVVGGALVDERTGRGDSIWTASARA